MTIASEQDRRAYQAAVEKAAWFDLSSYGKLELSGADAVTFLHNLCTNDIKKLPAGGGCEAFLCTAKARTIAHVLVSRIELGDKLLLDMMPGWNEKVARHLDKYIISEQVEIADRTGELAMLRLAGLAAKEFCEQALGTSVPEIRLLEHRLIETPLAGPCRIRRQDVLGLPGYDLFLSSERKAAVAKRLQEMGVDSASVAVHETLRLEAGTPEYGKDLDDERFVMEVGRTDRAISFTKGCYLGQEPIVMARDRGHVNRTLLRISVEGDAELAAGARLFQGETEAGMATSSAWSPRFEKVIALAYVKRGSQEPGTQFTIDGRVAMIV